MANVRAKFRVSTKVEGGEITLHAVHDDGTPENRRFAKATPIGEIRLQVDNASAASFFEPGENYYVDFSKAED